MRRIVIALTLAVLCLSAVFVLGQSGTPINDPGLKITIIHSTCTLMLAPAVSVTPEATADLNAPIDLSADAGTSATADVSETTPATEAAAAPAYPMLAPGTDCSPVDPLLTVHSNDTLWISLWLPNEPSWQRFSAVDNDPYPPRIDARGRFIGCSIPDRGEHTCRVLWDNLGTTYEIDIPLVVTGPYTGPAYPVTQPTTVPTQVISTPVPTPANSGVWGACGSCGTCGGPWQQCVQAPDNTCVWDAARCEHPHS